MNSIIGLIIIPAGAYLVTWALLRKDLARTKFKLAVSGERMVPATITCQRCRYTITVGIPPSADANELGESFAQGHAKTCTGETDE
jgi:hypothetical protein